MNKSAKEVPLAPRLVKTKQAAGQGRALRNACGSSSDLEMNVCSSSSGMQKMRCRLATCLSMSWTHPSVASDHKEKVPHSVAADNQPSKNPHSRLL
jgi:hypothetical protein